MTNTGTPALPAFTDLAPILGGPLGAHWYPAATLAEAQALVPLVASAEPRAMHRPLAGPTLGDPTRPAPFGVFVSLLP